MKISANILALNEEFWIKLQLDHIYDFFDEIVICEGAEKGRVKKPFCDDDGLSVDNMKEVIENYPDPQNKIKYKRFGWCADKVNMCNWMYQNSIGDYVWQIDSDEFYLLDVMQKIKTYLETHEDVNQIEFRVYHFWSGFTDCIHGPGSTWGDDGPWKRIFRREENNKLVTHRPPTVKYKTKGRTITRNDSYNQKWVLYHYGYVFAWQFKFKDMYYGFKKYRTLRDAWKKNKKQPLVRGSRTMKFNGEHPEIIKKLLNG
jgi:hypothetical protein